MPQTFHIGNGRTGEQLSCCLFCYRTVLLRDLYPAFHDRPKDIAEGGDKPEGRHSFA
jgi:hypothetical protein